MSNDGKTEFQSYYGKPIIKEPAWKPVIPFYFLSGGIAGASASLSFGASLIGNRRLSRNSLLLALAAITISTVLLIADLGRPSRFYNMLRMFKVTSPMSVGSWLLAASGGAVGIAGTCEVLRILPKVKAVCRGIGGVLGLPLATYTAALVADTAVPVWHEARRELPFVFAGSAAASAGAAAMMVTPSADAIPARRLTIAGVLLEAVATTGMERRLGPLLGEPYHQGKAGLYAKSARICTTTGGAIITIAGRKRVANMIGGALVIAGVLLERWAIFQAGFQSARDPKYIVLPQKERRNSVGPEVQAS